MMKLVALLVLTTASANFVQLGRTPVDTSSGGNYQWLSITFPTAFTSTPVVILGVPSSEGPNPAMGIIKDVTTTGFKFQIAEPSCYDEWHMALKFDWMAVLPGVYAVDGSTFEAGTYDATGVTGHTSTFETIAFAGVYASVPSVVAQIQDAGAHAKDNEYYINTRHHHLNTTSVGVLINEMANMYNMDGHDFTDVSDTGASIGYVIMEEMSSPSIQAKTTETSADCLSASPHANNCKGFDTTHIGGTHEEQATFAFSEALASDGFVFAQTITYNGPNHVTLRLESSATGSATASAVSGATDITMFLEEPGKCWKDGTDNQPHPNEEAASYMVFTATAFDASIAALTATATVTFDLVVTVFVEAEIEEVCKAVADTLKVDRENVECKLKSRRLVEADPSSATLTVTVITATAGVVEATIINTAFTGDLSTQLALVDVNTALTLDPATVIAAAATCSVHCTQATNTVLKVSHNTTSEHTWHKCYMDDVSQACICKCCDDSGGIDCKVPSNYQL